MNVHHEGCISPKTDLIISGTGSSSYVRTSRSWEWLLRSIRGIIESTKGPARVPVILSGGAVGWDHELTLAARELKLEFALCLPSPDYAAYYWGKKANRMKEYDEMFSAACSIEYVNESFIGRNGKAGHSNFDRNDRMAEVGEHFLVYDAGSPGTRHCVDKVRAQQAMRNDGLPFMHFCPR